MKTLPEVFLLIKWNPWPLVTHPHTPLLLFHLNAHLHHALLVRVFERISQIIRYHLPNSLWISIHRHSPSGGQVEENGSSWDCLALFINGHANNKSQVHDPHLEGQPPHLDTRRIQQIIY